MNLYRGGKEKSFWEGVGWVQGQANKMGRGTVKTGKKKGRRIR